MAPTLYYMEMSPPCRSVRLAAMAVGLPLDLKLTDVMKGETRTLEFMAINPQHTIPTFVDGDITLWESRAILQYIANQYGRKDAIYPKEPKLRAMVDRMLYFDFGTLYSAFGNFAFPVIKDQAKPDPENLAKIYDALVLLDQYLEGHFFAVGNRITIADFALVATVSTLEATGVDLLKYSNVKRWLERCKEQMTGYEDVNGKQVEAMGKFLKPKLRI